MTAIADGKRPRLLSGCRTKFDKVRGIWVLLAPERAIKLDPIGAAILSETDGERDFAALVDVLAAKYDAPRDQIARDAATFLGSLVEKRMMELS